MKTLGAILLAMLLLGTTDRAGADELVFTTEAANGPVAAPRSILVDDASGAMRDLTPPGVGAMVPCWSPDGTTLAFCGDSRSGFALHTMNVDDGVPRPIAAGIGASSPAWSPDGASIAFTGLSQGESWIFLVRPDGGDLRRLTRGALPAWSPDGARLAYYRTDRRPTEVWQVEVAAGDARYLAGLGSFNAPAGALGWSQDGAWIYFTETATTANGEWTGHVHRVRVFDGANTTVTTGRGERLLGVAPDGGSLVLLRATDAGDAALARLDVATGVETPLVDDEATARLADLELFSGRTVARLVWSPSGARIAFDLRPRDAAAPGEVYVVDVENGRLSAPIATAGRFGSGLAWRPAR